MRVILAGSAAARRRLRLQLEGVEVVDEHSTLAAARAVFASGVADAIVLSPDTTTSGDEDRQNEQPVEALTGREIQVLELMAEGLPNKAIATRLGISDQTVKFHVAAIAGKLGAANRTDAVRRAVRGGLITL
jgi:DNA-binding NarL/FixJ family response regulator